MFLCNCKGRQQHVSPVIPFFIILFFIFKNPVEGVLGLSWAFSLPLHDVVSGTAVDYMHCICEGAVDQHLKAWFEDKSCNQYLGNSLSEIDIALLSIKPISEITRRPRSISDWKQWKGTYLLESVWVLEMFASMFMKLSYLKKQKF